MAHEKIEFDDTRARTYRKRAEVLAFRSKAPLTFEKSWGVQNLRGGAWVIVPIDEDGRASDDVYGCDADVFADTYEPSPSLRPNRYRKRETIRAYQPHAPFRIDTVLEDGHREVEGSSTDSADAWIVRAPGGEVYPIENADFESSYALVQEPRDRYTQQDRDGHWSPGGVPKRILALDGGGVRGMVTLRFLARIEELLRARAGGHGAFRLSHYFDLIAGTSTGAIIAACLAKGMRVADVIEMYDKLAGDVFRGSPLRRGIVRAKFSAKRLRKHLRDVFQNNTMGSSAIETGLLVVAKRLDTGSIWAMSNNPRNRYFTARPGDSFFSNEDYLLRKVVRASTAAPSFFRPEYIRISSQAEVPQGEFVDGGASPHNNPALLALMLASTGGFGAGWSLDPDKLLLVSVGTGRARPGVSKSLLAGAHAVKSLLSLMNDCAESVETILQWLSESPTAREIDLNFGDLRGDLVAERPLFHYLRYDVALDPKWLEELLGEQFSEKRVGLLQRMDRPQSMKDLVRIGDQAAGAQVRDEHFPLHFDLQ